MRLLVWHEAWLVGREDFPNAVLSPLAELERARIEAARREVDLARHHYEGFLSRYDLPVPAQRRLVEEARAALARLSSQPALAPAEQRQRPPLIVGDS